MYCCGYFCIICIENNTNLINLDVNVVLGDVRISLFEMLLDIKPEMLNLDKAIHNFICSACKVDLITTYNCLKRLNRSYTNFNKYLTQLRNGTHKQTTPPETKEARFQFGYNAITSRHLLFHIKKLAIRRKKSSKRSFNSNSVKTSISSISSNYTDTISDAATIILTHSQHSELNCSDVNKSKHETASNDLLDPANVQKLNDNDLIELDQIFYATFNIDEHSINEGNTLDLGSCDLSDISSVLEVTVLEPRNIATIDLTKSPEKCSNTLESTETTKTKESPKLNKTFKSKPKRNTNIITDSSNLKGDIEISNCGINCDVDEYRRIKNESLQNKFTTSTPVKSKKQKTSSKNENENNEGSENNLDLSKLDPYKSYLSTYVDVPSTSASKELDTSTSTSTETEVATKQVYSNTEESNLIDDHFNVSPEFYVDDRTSTFVEQSRCVDQYPITSELNVDEQSICYNEEQIRMIKTKIDEMLEKDTSTSTIATSTSTKNLKRKLDFDPMENLVKIPKITSTVETDINLDLENRINILNVDVQNSSRETEKVPLNCPKRTNNSATKFLIDLTNSSSDSDTTSTNLKFKNIETTEPETTLVSKNSNQETSSLINTPKNPKLPKKCRKRKSKKSKKKNKKPKVFKGPASQQPVPKDLDPNIWNVNVPNSEVQWVLIPLDEPSKLNKPSSAQNLCSNSMDPRNSNFKHPKSPQHSNFEHPESQHSNLEHPESQHSNFEHPETENSNLEHPETELSIRTEQLVPNILDSKDADPNTRDPENVKVYQNLPNMDDPNSKKMDPKDPNVENLTHTEELASPELNLKDLKAKKLDSKIAKPKNKQKGPETGKTSSEPKQRRCPFCRIKLEVHCTLKWHIFQKHRDKYNECPICYMTFPKREILNTHFINCQMKNPQFWPRFPNVCDAQVPDLRNVNFNGPRFGPPPFARPPFIQAPFFPPNNFRLNDANERLFICKLCSKCFPNDLELSNHAVMHYDDEERYFKK